jgi:hypothetical protein
MLVNELEKVRARKKRRKASKMVLFLVAVVFVGAASLRFKEQISFICNRIALEYKGLRRGESFPLPLTGELPVCLENCAGNLLLVCENHATVYSGLSGAKILGFEHSASSGGLTFNKNRIATYNYSNGSLDLYDRFAKSHFERNGTATYDVSLANDGKIAVIGSASHYASSVVVMEQEGKKVFEWNLADDYAFLTAFSNDSHEIAIVTFGSLDGLLRLRVNLFNIASGELQGRFDVKEAIYHLAFVSGGRMVVITDSNAYFLGSGLQLEGKFGFAGEELKMFNCQNGLVALCFRECDANSGSFKLVILDATGNKLGEKNIDTDTIESMKCSKSGVGVATDKGITLFDRYLRVVKNYYFDTPVFDFACVGNYLFVIDSNELRKYPL